LGVQLFENDCSTAADATALVIVNNTDGDVLNIDLDIVQETITTSAHYNEITAAEAAISFCLRVDYTYDNGVDPAESINFTTNVTTVDLTANFTLTGIVPSVLRPMARPPTSSSTTLYRPISARTTTVWSLPRSSPGSFLQVCVKIDDAVTTDNILVEDILTLSLSPAMVPLVTPETITNGVADP
jgi:hypothetical protein